MGKSSNRPSLSAKEKIRRARRGAGYWLNRDPIVALAEQILTAARMRK
jgi:hypothetical protein